MDEQHERIRAWINEAAIQHALREVQTLNLEQTHAAQSAINQILAALRVQTQANMRILAALDVREAELSKKQ